VSKLARESDSVSYSVISRDDQVVICVRRLTSNTQFLRRGCALGGDIGSLGAVGIGLLGFGGPGNDRVRGIG
jgi:hypothetical protein